MTLPTEEQVMEKRVYRAVSNYMKNELFGGADPDGRGWKEWMRKEVKEGATVAFKGHDAQSWVENAVRHQVGIVISKWGNKDAVKTRVEEIIREEVKVLIKDRLHVSASLSLDINPTRYDDEALF